MDGRGGDVFLETVIAERKVAVRRVPDLADQSGIQLIPKQLSVCRAAARFI